MCVCAPVGFLILFLCLLFGHKLLAFVEFSWQLVTRPGPFQRLGRAGGAAGACPGSGEQLPSALASTRTLMGDPRLAGDRRGVREYSIGKDHWTWMPRRASEGKLRRVLANLTGEYNFGR